MSVMTTAPAPAEELTEGWYALYSFREIGTKVILGFFATEDEAYETATAAAEDDRSEILGDLADDAAIQPVIIVEPPEARIPDCGVFG